MTLLQEKTAPLHGLIMPGGGSQRMPQGGTQTEVCARLLRPHCEKIFLSVRESVPTQPGLAALEQLKDGYVNMGPLGGILTALESNPACAWLIVTSQHPLLDEATLAFLVENRAPLCHATAFRNPGDDQPEPLFAIYEPSALAHFIELMDNGITLPSEMLLKSDIQLIDPPFLPSQLTLKTPEDAPQLLWWIKDKDRKSG